MFESSWLRRALLTMGVTAAVMLTARAAHPQPQAQTAPAPVNSAAQVAWSFDDDTAFAADSKWIAVDGDWEVLRDPTAPSLPNAFGLAYYGLPRTKYNWRWITSFIRTTYPIAVVKDPTEYSDFTVEAYFKSAGGSFDSSGGLIFRYVDPQDYYVLAAECPGDHLALYRMRGGDLKLLSRVSTPIKRETWYKLKAQATGNNFVCYLDDRKMFETADSSFGKGRIGLWARDDSRARFDSVTLTILPPADSHALAAPEATHFPLAAGAGDATTP
jgi:hypothetical protein